MPQRSHSLNKARQKMGEEKKIFLPSPFPSLNEEAQVRQMKQLG